ncbi:MAG: DUF892 family protein [Vulcanimicrobiota bacterium]
MQLKELLEDQIKDIYSAETQVSEALPKLAKAASSEKLAKAFRDHLAETRGQIDRLKEIAKKLDMELEGEECEAAKGLIEEGEQLIEEHEMGPGRDAGLIAAAQRFEHYEMAAYGTIRDFAKELGLRAVAELLQETLDEESQANELLTKIAHGGINREAVGAGNGKSQSKGRGMNLQELSRDELYEIAQEKGLSGRSAMSKKELVQALR